MQLPKKRAAGGVAAGVVALGSILGLILGASPAHALSAQDASSAIDAAMARHLQAAAKIVPAAQPLQCVPFARQVSGIRIHGDAWTWWRAAEGRYARGQRPEVGAVLVMKKTRRLNRGHLAVVKRVLDSRTVLVDQANWLNRGQVHLNTAVLDVSRRNDWSAVRVWYTPGGRYGSRTYAVHGFIYPTHPAVRAAGFEAMPLPRRRPDAGGPGERLLAGLSYASAEGIEHLGPRIVPRRAPGRPARLWAAAVSDPLREHIGPHDR